MAIRIGIADDHLMILKGFEIMLQAHPGCELLFTALNSSDLLGHLEKNTPDILLLDIQIPDINGIELCKIVTEKYPSVRVIALTNHEESIYVKKMIRNGAMGYLLKSTDPETLIKAIDTVYSNVQFIDSRVEKTMLAEVLSGKKKGNNVLLTKRETEILTMIAGELSNQEIAEKLFISLRTVETHRLNITQKLDVKNTAGLVKEAYLRGLMS